MTNDRQRQVEELFIAAADLPKEARAPFLREHCADDSGLRREVEALLAHDEQAGQTFMNGTSPSATPAADAGVPTRLGAYRIIRQIGVGGMGVVYEAEQESPRRSVALKVVRPGTISRQVLRRFAYESQVLGQLTHPGIARIFEAGEFDSPEGRQPFFAMEFISGQPLDAYCRRRALDVRARLELIASICDAVEHAHSRGVIHRDLKPGNILVDDAGQPKVLDFGVARLAGRGATRVTMATSAGQLIGTLPYMSPEQVSADPSAVDARTDVYALGVILYELLAGKLPHDVSTLPIPEAIRMIREDDPTSLAAVSAYFRGDVDTIVAKAINKEPDRRYPSAAELAGDIRRYLQDEPIRARPTGTFYQLRKFARRNRALVGGVIATMVVLVLGAATSTYLAIGQARQRARAELLTHAAQESEQQARRLAYSASIAAAQGAVTSDDTLSLRSRLADTPAEFRGWEWRYLNFLSDRSIAHLDVPMSSSLPCVAGPDGTIYLGLRDASLAAWDGRRTVRTLVRLPGQIVCIDLDHAGTRLLAVLSDRIMMVDVSGNVLWTRPGQFGLWGRAFDPTGTKLLIADRVLGQSSFLDARNGEDLGRLGDPDPGIAAAGWSNTGRYSFSGRLAMCVRETSTGARITPELLMAPAFSADDSIRAQRIDQGDAVICDTQTGATLATLPVFGRDALHWQISDRFVICGEGIGTVGVFDRRTNTRCDTVLCGGRATSVCMLPDGRYYMAASSNDPTPRIFDAAAGPQPRTAATGVDSSSSSDLAPDGASIATGGWGSIAEWDVRSAIRRKTSFWGDQWVVSVSWSPDSSAIAGITERGDLLVVQGSDIRAWRADSRVRLAHPAIAWIDSSTIAATSDTSDLLIARLQPGAITVTRRPMTSTTRSLGSHAGTAVLAAGLDDGTAQLIQPSGEVVRTLRAHSTAVTAIAFSHDGAMLTTGSAGGEVRIWDRSSMEQVASHQFEGTVHALAWASDGSRIAVAGEGVPIAIVSPATGEDLLRLRIDSTRPPRGIAFSPDDRTLYALGPPQAWIAFESALDPSPEIRYTRFLTEEAQKLVTAWRRRLYVGDELERLIAADTAAPTDIRDVAVRIARGEGDIYRWTNASVWGVVSSAHLEAREYDRAIKLAEMIADKFPDNGGFINTLGVAYYRSGRYEDALRTLRRSDELNRKATGASHPVDLAVLAMTLSKQGHREQAAEFFSRLQAAMAIPQNARDRDNLLFMAEARVLLGQQP